MEERGRIMALDVGDARTGVAVTDLSQTIVSPHAVVAESSREKALMALVKIIEDQEPILIVAGLPLLENGDEGPQAKKVQTFVSMLATRVNAPIVFEDERYSTIAADEVFHSMGGKGRKRKGVIDKIAAAQILQSYLNRNE